jgi:hypothetical protein
VPKPISIHSYSKFAEQLRADLNDYGIEPFTFWLDKANRSVNGLAEDELRRLVSIEDRRKYGAFFTPSKLACKIAKDLFPSLDKDVVIYDPACGAGNLLLASIDHLTKRNILPAENQFLYGTDIHSEFVSAAENRILIKQLIQHNSDTAIHQANNFKIEQSDGLLPNEFYLKASHIFVNPPFNLTPAPKDIYWAKGKVCAAALFIHKIIENVKAGTTITCILPEVLRCGSRYNAWRGLILDSCIIEKVKMYGQFDQHADVDVFGILLRKRERPIKRKNKNNRFSPQARAQLTIDKKFTISVGTVVDNRDLHKGIRRGYIISRGLSGWSIQKKIIQCRNHQGKSLRGPFIVIKRTSRMGDSQRAIATIINTPNPVYVDNHLIVLQPKSQKLKDCELMLENLKDARTDKWLNDEIRCRHLTVRVVSNIPVWQ